MAPGNITGVILSGGKSSRMGRDKAFIEINSVPLIYRTVRLFRDIFDEIIIVTNSPMSYLDINVTIASDIFPDKGPLGGLYTGLFYASHSRCFVCACDMPFLNGPFIEYMINISKDREIIVPDLGDGWQPLHAIYHRKCLVTIRKLFDKKKFKIIDFYGEHKTFTIREDMIKSFDSEGKMFLNVNTDENLMQIQSLL